MSGQGVCYCQTIRVTEDMVYVAVKTHIFQANQENYGLVQFQSEVRNMMAEQSQLCWTKPVASSLPWWAHRALYVKKIIIVLSNKCR